jgi:hypothetical protein
MLISRSGGRPSRTAPGSQPENASWCVEVMQSTVGSPGGAANNKVRYHSEMSRNGYSVAARARSSTPAVAPTYISRVMR